MKKQKISSNIVSKKVKIYLDIKMKLKNNKILIFNKKIA